MAVELTADAAVEAGYSGKQTAEIVGITYRQLDYWARTDLVRPSLADAHGSGTRRRYSYRDLLELRVIKDLLDAGIKLQSVRTAFTYLRENLGEDVASANLVISGDRSVLVRSGEEIVDIVQAGQGVLNILPLAGVKEEVDAAIIDLYPAESEAKIDTEGPGRAASAHGCSCSVCGACSAAWPSSRASGGRPGPAIWGS